LPLTFHSTDLSLELFRQPQSLQYRMRERAFQSIFYLRSFLEQEVWRFFSKHGFLRTDPNIITSSDCEGAGELFYLTASTETTTDEKPFFGRSGIKPALTVSSQLPLEFLCAGQPGVWTLNPSFRAEKSSTQRHLAEFRHLEWESHQLGSLDSLMSFNEEIVRFLIQSVLTQKDVLRRLDEDLRRLGVKHEKTCEERLGEYISADKWTRLSYTEALEICHKSEHKARILEIWKKDSLPEWGDDLGTMCERYLTDYIYKAPVIIHSYPRVLKSFYMKQDKADSQGRVTVQGCDLLMPGMGELIGSSVREEDYDTLVEEMDRRGMDKKGLEWYLDLRRNATFPHGGAGLGFDRLVQALIFEAGSIRDVVPCPVAYQYLSAF
jgi:asparaginyl-tRNA synthetase